MSPQPALRLTRASVFSAVCMGLATVGHSAVSRAAVAPWAIGVGFVAVLAVAWVLTGVERSLATILGGLLGGQFALHVLFAATQPGATTMEHSGVHPVMAPVGHGGMTMTLAHVAAAVVSAWWLRRGERAVWALARRAAALALWPLPALLDPAPVMSPAPVTFRTSSPARPRSTDLRHCVVRRGPPFRPTAPALG